MDSRLKRAAWRGALVALAATANVAFAATFNLFQPASGILVGNPSTYITTAATSANVISLFSGTCNIGTFLRADGQCATASGSGGGTVSSVGLTMPTGFTVTGSPVTGSSSIGVTTTLSGVLKGTGSGFANAAASDVVALFSTCSGTQYLGADAACHTAATVSSVAMTAPSVFTITGSPITGSGTLAVTFATGQTANQVLASPNGSSGAVALRALVGADIPAVNLAGTGNGGTTGVMPFSKLTIASSNVIGLWTGTCSASNYLRGDGACASPAGAGTVTSVAMTAPSVFTVGGSPVTGAGTLAVTFATGQTANSFLATPSGTTGTVGLRALVSADLPSTISSNTTGNAATAAASNASPTQCSGGQYATGVTTAWAANCAQVAYSQLSGVPGAANPSGHVGPTATNGSATTFMRSDAAPAIDLTASYTWTGGHLFAGTVSNSVATSGVAIGLAAGFTPVIDMTTSTAPTDAKQWQIYVDNTAGVFNMRTVNDAGTATENAITFSRSGINITSMMFGNSTNQGTTTIGLDGATSIVCSSCASGLSIGTTSDNSNGLVIHSKGSGGSAGITLDANGVEAMEIVNNQSGSASVGVPSGALGIGTLTGQAFYFGFTGGVMVGSAGGGPQGNGSLNAQGLYVNGAAVLTSISGGATKFAGATIGGGASSCAVGLGGGIASCSVIGTGDWQINFTSGLFTSYAICAVTGEGNSPLVNNGVQINGVGASSVQVVAFNTATGALLSTSAFNVSCVGS